MTRLPAQTVRPNRLLPPLLGVEDVDRPRLTATIRATPPSGTCVLSAPPGYGATTAAVQALSQAPGVAWVGLDEFDVTPTHFWTQLTAALERVDAGEPGALPAPHGDDDVLALMASLVERVSASTCTWIVLDGVDSDLHRKWLPALAYLMANLPRETRLLLTTHDALLRMPVDPADRRLMAIDREQLAATADEAARIALATGPDLDIDTVEEITTAADGWVAAIRSAARYATRHPSDNAGHWLVTKGVPALLDPWLDRLPPELLGLLVDTAFLNQLSGPLCDAVLEVSGTLDLLDALESHGSYVEAIPPPLAGDPHRWWARHPLVTAALAHRSTTRTDPERDLRAASWFQEHGDFESTMRHLVAAGRLDDAGSYLSRHENALFEKGRGDRAAAWYASLPPDSWGQLGWHLVRLTWGQAMGRDPQSAEATLAQLRAHLATRPVDEREQQVLRAEVATVAAYLATLAGDTATSVSSARSAIDLFREESPDNSQQIAPMLLLRALLWDGDVDGARREFARIRFQPFATGLLREGSLAALKAQFLVDEGHISQAKREVRRAMKWLADHGLTAREVSQFTLMTADGSATLESGNPLGAVTRLEASIDGAIDRGGHGDAAAALIWLARARLSLGELAEALACVQRARQLLHETAPTSSILFRLDLTEAFVRHVAGDSVRAERLVQRVPASDARTLMWARVTMHRQASGARRSLAAVDTETPRLVIEKQVLLAQIAMRLNHSVAEGHLTRAADLAGANGFLLALLGSPAELLDLAGSLASRTSHDTLAQLVQFAGSRESGVSADTDVATPGPSGVAPPLSAGELELIAFLPRRDSNADIARQLGVSVNTIKTRLYRMYRKLGVDSRDEAIAAARGRGLIV